MAYCEFLTGAFQGRVPDGFLVEPVIAQGAAELSQHLNA